MLLSLVIRDAHDKVNRLTTELQSPTSAGNGDWSWGTPATLWSAAGSYSFAVTTAKAHRYFHHGRNHCDTFRVLHHLVWNRLLRRAHDLGKDASGIIDPLFDVWSFLFLC